MKTILVASDFSACAANALEYAIELANILHFQVTVIHAIGSTEGVNNNTYNALYIDEYYAKKRHGLNEWTQKVTVKNTYSHVPVTTLCEVGTVANVITKYIETNTVELLVMGTMGSTGIAGLFGSNTSTMMARRKTPMLVVPLESKFSPNPVITLATDFTTRFSQEDVNALNELLTAYGLAKLVVLNVVAENNWKTNEAGETMLKGLLPGIQLEFSYISEGSTTDGIMNFITANQTDILCVVKHHHNILYRLFTRSTVKPGGQQGHKSCVGFA